MRVSWFLGATVLIVFLTLGRRRIDYRMVLLGALLPDLIDRPVGGWVGEPRSFAHTFLFSLVLLLAVQLILRGDAARRWFVLPIAMLIHLALEGMWSQPETLFWPLFGSEFSAVPVQPSWLRVAAHPADHPVRALGELGGLAILLYMGYAYDLHRPARRRQFLKTGTL